MFPESRLRPHPTCFHPSTLRLPGPQLTRPSCLFQMVKLYLCTDFCPLGGVAGANQSCGRAQEMECPWKRLAKSNPPEEQSGYSHVHRRKSYYPACRFFFPPLSSRMHSKSIGLLSQSKRCYYQEPQCWVEVFIFIFSGTIIAKYVT